MKRIATTAVLTAAVFLAMGPSAFAATAGCAGGTCLTVEGSGRYVARASASPASPADDFFGHYRLSGLGRKNTESAVRHWRHGQFFTVALGRDLPAGTVVCAEGFEHIDGQVKPHGKACVKIPGASAAGTGGA
ncbi:hypothetical protein AB0K09_33200, partial [Streptomyces sp. NPDC049577]|uniref:hypothetical protein n=1 Tax=Streptomyces sp. NPDC049577 TaxID=3155153 RepID=UPI0034456AF3